LELEQEKARLLQDQVDIKKDQAAIDKTNTDEAKKQQEIAKQIADLEKEKQRAQFQYQADVQRDNMVFPELKQLALARVWGGYRAGWVRTDQGEMAHRILMLQKDQMHQREWGNITGADWDASEIGRLKGILGAEGFMPKDEKLDAVNAHLADLNWQITALRNGTSLNVTIADVTDDK
jgi:hypothetical protein